MHCTEHLMDRAGRLGAVIVVALLAGAGNCRGGGDDDPVSPIDPAPCTERAFYADVDGDGVGAGAAILACTQPRGTVARAGDNCPSAPNSSQVDSDGDGVGDVCDPTPAPATCPDCHENGGCDPDTLQCVCDLGASGPGCEACVTGFTATVDGHCVLAGDGAASEWPNPFSRRNSDPWLAVHHDKIERLRPKVLVLNFDNGLASADADRLVDQVIAGFAEGSRPRGSTTSSTPQLLYERARSVVDLRDARPPAGWTLPNSSLYPRKGTAGTSSWTFDYARLFDGAFASRYGFVDQNNRAVDLCGLVEAGAVHEVWVLVSPNPDAPMAEVLEMKQVYDDVSNKMPGAFDRCAGNGCFAADVPVCGRSIRIGAINSGRGPGCYLHSQGHGMEGLAQRRAIPALSSWFLPFARLDLDTRHHLPMTSLYGLRCTDSDGDGGGDRDCVRFHDETRATFVDGPRSFGPQTFDPGCGSVHFAPNSTWHYETMSDRVVQSSCEGFGRHEGVARADRLRPTSASLWRAFEDRFPDCGGGFLVWWMQHMPAFGSQQSFDDGTPMQSVWPFLFY